MTRMDLLDAKAVNMGLRERVLGLMERHRLNTSQFAQACGISRYTVSGWVNRGHVPNGYSIYVICETFGVSANWLFGLNERR